MKLDPRRERWMTAPKTRALCKREGIHLLVFNSQTEEVVVWIP